MLILQSLVLQGQDKPDSALTTLQRAIALAGQEGYVRVFVDEGEIMLRLLRLLVARFGATDYSAKLISAFPRRDETSDVLNDRELEILRLLATSMSNREIGEALSITEGTVKWHAHPSTAKPRLRTAAGGVQGQRTSRDLQLDCMRTYCIQIDAAEWCLVSLHILIMVPLNECSMTN